MRRRLITAADIQKASRSGKKSIDASETCIITPMAKDEAEALDIAFICEKTTSVVSDDHPPPKSTIHSDNLTRTISDLIKAKGISNAPSDEIVTMVQKIVENKLGTAGEDSLKALEEPTDKPENKNNKKIRFVNGQNLLTADNGLPVSEKALVINSSHADVGEKLAGGWLVWEDAAFHRCLEAPEITVVIEGKLHIIIDAKTLVAKPGDMIYFPQGATVEFYAPGKVKLACVTCV